MKDKKFKAVNREENYAKGNAPDVQLGQHSALLPMAKAALRRPSFLTVRGDSGEKPQQSTSRKMKTYQARQPTNDNEANTADIPHSADIPYSVDTRIDEAVHQQRDNDSNNDTAYQSDLQMSKSDAAFREENTDMRQPSPQHKNRTYQRHTQFAQKHTDYDFTQENHSENYSFTAGSEPSTSDTSEQPENAADVISDNAERIINNDVPRSEPPKTSYKKYYRRQNPYHSKGADFDFTESTKDTDYNISDTARKRDYDISDTSQNDKPFERAERKTDSNSKSTKDTNYNISDVAKECDYDISDTSQNDKPFERTERKTDGNSKDKHKKQRNYKQDTAVSDEPDTRHDTAEPEPDEDYNIREAVESSDTAFVRVAETDKSETEPKTVRKKNKRLQQKQRLKMDDTISPEPTTDKSNAAQSEHSAENPSKDYQFKRAGKTEFKAKKARDKADKAEQKLPHKKKIKRQRLYDEEKQKPKTRLTFENEVKPQNDLYHRSPIKSAAAAASVQLANKAHAKVSEVEHENSAVEGAHKSERAAETLAHYSVRTATYISQNKKAVPYKRAQRLRFKAKKAEVKAMYQRTLAENPELKKSLLKKMQQKRQIKKKYQQMKQAEQNAKVAKKSAKTAAKATERAAALIWRHKRAFAVVLVLAIVICWAATMFSSCAVMGISGLNSIMTSSYFAEDEDIYMAEGYYSGLEADLQTEIDNIEIDYSSYDEYNYTLAQIGHNPYELVSYLTAKYECFTFSDIENELNTLFMQQYVLTLTEEVETRTDDEGNEYDYYILNIELVNNNLNILANTNLSDDQRELYEIYLESKGNRDYLFADDIYSNEVTPPSYTIPGEALSDNTFRTLITEAERYLGYPYVWGGSSPSTSFDCSGFVCWVFKNSGVYPLERTTAQGIYNQCSVVSREDAKPGDIIFFKGTYNTSEVSHVGIYVGDGMMIHCGNPIQYTSIESSYWTQHYYAMGRLN